MGAIHIQKTVTVTGDNMSNIKVLPYLRNQYGYQLRNYQLKWLMGLNPKAHLPEYRGSVLIGHIWVRVASKTEAHAMSPKSKRPHRILALCPHCEEWVPAGRLQQHIPIHGIKLGHDDRP